MKTGNSCRRGGIRACRDLSWLQDRRAEQATACPHFHASIAANMNCNQRRRGGIRARRDLSWLQDRRAEQATACPHFHAIIAANMNCNQRHAKWLLSWKVDELGRAVKAKSRLVVHGSKQRVGISLGETFVFTVSSFCMRFLVRLFALLV